MKKKVDNSSDEDIMNSKILKITMTIMEQYPEMLQYLEEMPVTIPNEKNPEITLKNLNAYYESLKQMLDNYKSEFKKSTITNT